MIALKMVAGSTIHCQLNALGSIPTWAVDGALGLLTSYYGWKTVLWLLEETHVLKVVGSTSSIVYWMDIFHINLL